MVEAARPITINLGVDRGRPLEGIPAELARGLQAFGRYKVEQGELVAGKDLLREALVIFTKLGMPGKGQEVERVLSAVQ